MKKFMVPTIVAVVLGGVTAVAIRAVYQNKARK